MSAEQKLKELGIELLEPGKVLGVYKPAIVVGNMVYTSGHGPVTADGLITGKVAGDAEVEEGYQAARQAGMAILTTLRQTLGSLDKVKRVVKIFGLVQCPDDFQQQPAVINGCSELFRDVFGEDTGVGARSAVGANSLPANMKVEIEAIFEIDA